LVSVVSTACVADGYDVIEGFTTVIVRVAVLVFPVSSVAVYVIVYVPSVVGVKGSVCDTLLLFLIVFVGVIAPSILSVAVAHGSAYVE
jgi:hypothetical protein